MKDRFAATGYVFRDSPIDDIAATCGFAGLAGIEGTPPMVEGLSDDEIRRKGEGLAAAGVAVSTFHLPFAKDDDVASFYETTRRAAVELIGEWMKKASFFGAGIGILHPSTCRLHVSDEGLEPFITQICKSLGELAPRAEELGFVLAVENMLPADGDRFFSKPEHIIALRDSCSHESVKFCYDSGHGLVSMGIGDQLRVLEAMGDRVAAFHLADNGGDRDSHLAPGNGHVDWPGLFRQARSVGFAGTYCIETPPFAPGPDYSNEAWREMADTVRGLAAQTD